MFGGRPSCASRRCRPRPQLLAARGCASSSERPGSSRTSSWCLTLRVVPQVAPTVAGGVALLRSRWRVELRGVGVVAVNPDASSCELPGYPYYSFHIADVSP
jgi:hypothetical protein